MVTCDGLNSSSPVSLPTLLPLFSGIQAAHRKPEHLSTSCTRVESPRYDYYHWDGEYCFDTGGRSAILS